MKYNYTAMDYYNKYYTQMKPEPTAEERVNRFLRKYESSAELSTRKLYARRVPIRYDEWVNNGGPIPFEQTVEREPMVEIHMPKHRFQDLIEREDRIDSDQNELRRYKEIMQDMYQEERIRNNNPALKKAWENYQLLLRLCDSK